MKIFWAPEDSPVDPLPAVREKAARLAATREKQFLLLPAGLDRETVEWILASFLSPLAVVPLSPHLPPAARARILSQLPAASFVEPGDLPSTGNPSFRAKPLSQTWAVLFSSGSTGEPKGLALSGEALRRSAEAHGEHNGNLSWLLNLPLHHVGGFSVLSRAYFLDGSVGACLGRFDAEETLGWIRSRKVEGLSLVPTTAQRLLDLARPGDFSPLKMVLLGGAPADSSLKERAAAAGLRLHLTYGLTEHCSQAATEKAPGGGLEALPGVEIKTAADGEILLRSGSLASGAFREGCLQPLPLTDGFFATGDLGRVAGRRLEVRGRKSDLIISGGLNIFPAEIEQALLGAPGVKDCGVVGLASTEWGEAVCAALVGEATPDTVREYLATRIDPRKIPKVWVSVATIPRSATGKVLRLELKGIVENSL